MHSVVLTHFSTRYPTMPEMELDHICFPVGVATDFMTLNLADLQLLPQARTRGREGSAGHWEGASGREDLQLLPTGTCMND